MSGLFPADQPDRTKIRLRLMDENLDITRFVSYEVTSDFLTPSDGWHFVIADEALPETTRDKLKLGTEVALFVGGNQVLDGHIDSVEINASRSSGWQWTIAGRDNLGFVVDATADPTLQFKEGATLFEFLRKLFTPFGWVTDEQYSVDASADRQATTGIRAIKESKGGKKKGPKPLKKLVLHQLKPYNHEGLFAFASRVAQRHGLWIWSSSDGDTLIVSQPDFSQASTYQIRRNRDGNGNVLEGTVRFDYSDQPAVIFADAYGGGGEFGKGRIKAFVVNPYFGVDDQGFVLDQVTQLTLKFPEAQQVVMGTEPFKHRVTNVPIRPMFLHDDESKTPEQLANFLRREMSLLLRKSLHASYLVEGHGQLINGIFVPWDVDTVVDVQDDAAGLNEKMYILSRTFSKSRTGGTHTRLELIRLGSIQFGDDIPPGASPTPSVK